MNERGNLKRKDDATAKQVSSIKLKPHGCFVGLSFMYVTLSSSHLLIRLTA